MDEPGHFQYVKYVSEYGALPRKDADVPPLLVGGSDINCEHSTPTQHATRCVARGSVVNEPPLYYLLAAPFVVPIDLNSNVSWVANPYFTWWGHPLRDGAAIHTLAELWPYHGMVLGAHVMRAVSALMVAGAIAAIYFMALAIRQSRSFALLAAAAGALTPGLLLSSASVNNDNAAILTGSLALLAAVKALTSSARRWLWVGMYGLMAFLAVQSKASAYFLLPVSVLLAGLMLRNRGRRALIASGLGVLAATVLGGLALQTTRFSMLPLLHSVPSVLQADWDCNCTMFLQHYWGAIPNLWETYWGSYGWETFHPPQPAYRPFTLVTVLGVAGLLWGCWRKLRSGTLKSWLASDRGASLVLLVSAFFVLLVMVDYRVLATRSDGGTTHARFLFPAVAASTIFLVLGISALPDLLRKTGFFVLFSASLALVAYSVFVLPRSFGLTVPVYGDPEAAGAQELLAADFSNGMQLVGWSRPDGGVAPGQQLHLRLFWGASKPPDFDYSAFVRLDDRNGLLVHDADHGPGASIQLLSHLWQPGEVIPDDWTINLPASAHPGQYQVEVGLYDYRDLKPVVDTQNQAYVTLGNVTV